MATTLFTVFLTFLLMGLVANRVSQRWQYRNWISQQRFSDNQKEFQTLQDLFDEVAGLSSKRQHKMIRLLAAIRSLDAEKTQQRLTDYDAVVVEWNEHLNAIYAKLTMHLSFDLTKRLEDDIHKAFVTLDATLVALAQKKIFGEPIDRSQLTGVQQALNALQGRLFAFDRDILRHNLERKKAALYTDPFTPQTLDTFPTWELLKALFKTRVER
jgi:hypothetical protein